MAIFRDGVKIGKFDVRTSVSKERAKGLLTKGGILGVGALLGKDDKGRGIYTKDAKGSIQTIRTVIGKGEGFQIPANFKVAFKMPRGIEHASGGPRQPDSPGAGKVKTGGLDWKTHIMNKSTDKEFRGLWAAAQQSSGMLWKKVVIHRTTIREWNRKWISFVAK